MTLNDTIYKRKSTRRFDMTPLEDNQITAISKYAGGLVPLDNTIKTGFKIVGNESVRTLMPWKAPHYIAVFSEKKDGYLENIGFMYQQLDLYLQSIGLGVCWLGLAKFMKNEEIESAFDRNFDDSLDFVIMLAFGNSRGSSTRDASDFKRNHLIDITDKADPRLEPARLAPSSTNSQPWYFVHDSNFIHAYCIQHGPIKAKMYGKYNKIDMGIALAHIYITNPDTFKFFKAAKPAEKEGYYYIGSFEI